MNAPPSAYRIQQALAVWHSRREAMLADGVEPDEVGPATDDVRDILMRLLRGAVDDADMADKANDRAAEIKVRAERYKRRADDKRATAFAIMDVLGERKIEMPDLTATIGKGRQTVVITDETALADKYVKVERKPIKSDILEDLKQGVVIDGAELSNGLPSLTIRTR